MKKKYVLSLICTSALATFILGASTVNSTNVIPTAITAHAADTSFDISNFKDGQWYLYCKH